MTYEDKLLAVFARFRGEALDSGTLEQMERVCNDEVWQHLPHHVRSSWRLHLAFSEETPGQIELRPHQLREDGASPAELEAALRSPFREEEPVRGGFVTSFNFNASTSAPSSPTGTSSSSTSSSSTSSTSTSSTSTSRATVAQTSVRAESGSPAPQSAAVAQASPGSATREKAPAARSALEQIAFATKSDAPPVERALDARSIHAQAQALGISLPPNSSLLGPFLEALSLATHYRERAERAEAELGEILARLDRVAR